MKEKTRIEYTKIEGEEILENEIDAIELNIIDRFLFLRTRKDDAMFKIYSLPDLDSITIT